MWGLHEYAVATGDVAARDAVRRTAELLLEHRIFRALKTGEPIKESFVTIHSPPFWHYDYFQALVVLVRMGLADDPRALLWLAVVVVAAAVAHLFAARRRASATIKR